MKDMTIDDIMNEVVGEVRNSEPVEVKQQEKQLPQKDESLDELTAVWNCATLPKKTTSTSKALSENNPFTKEEEIIDFYLRKIITEPYMTFALQFCFDVPTMDGLELGKSLMKRRVPGHVSLKYRLEQEIVFFSRLVTTLKFNQAKQDAIDDAECMLHNRLTSLSAIVASEEKIEMEEQEEELRRSMKKGKKMRNKQ